jgi:hypothetical protein
MDELSSRQTLTSLMAKKGCLPKVLWGLAGTFLVLLAWGMAIDKKCVAGDSDYEKGTGFCGGNGRKDVERRKAEAKKQEAMEKEKRIRERQAIEAEKKQEALVARTKENEKTLREIGYICEASIRKNLRDPGSYERIESTSYGLPTGEGKKGVVIKYRARNGFGGMNVEQAACLTETGKIEDLRFAGSTEDNS